MDSGEIREKKNVELIKKIQQGDENAFNEFYQNNLRLVYFIAEKYSNLGKSNPMLFNKEDLTQEASMVLFNAIKEFDVTKNIKFSTFYAFKCHLRFCRLYKKYVKMQLQTTSLNEKVFEDSDDEIVDLIPSERTEKEFERLIDRIDSEKFKKDTEKILSPREAFIFEQVVICQTPIKEIQKTLMVSKQRISQIYISARKKIKKMFEENSNE